MNKEDCFYFGYVSKTIGLKGEIGCVLDVDNPNNYKKLKLLYVEINNKLIPYNVKHVRASGKKTSILLETIDIIDKAQELIGTTLYIPLSNLTPLKGNDFYFHEVIGFEVYDITHGNIGKIEKVLEYPQQAILQINNGKNEILIPVNKEFIIDVNREQKTMNIQTPEGLIELYIEPKNSKRED